MNNSANKNPQSSQFIASIKNLSHDGRGIAIIENKTTFLENALPDETVQYQLHQKKPTFNEGKVTDVITPSPHRTVPPCAHFGVCGGCSLQHMSDDL